jgi:predicted lipoprotein
MAMTRFPFFLFCASLALGITGCKFVKDAPAGEKVIAVDASGDDARTAQRIADTFKPKLLPYVHDHAMQFLELRTALSKGLDAAGQAHGTKGSGEGAAWNFPVSGSGKVVESKLNTRARTVGLDIDGDGASDVTIQLGPVIKGTALRDVAPFYNFDDFRDQIEFAKLARALNDQVDKTIDVPGGDLVGMQVSFAGVVPLKKADEPFLVTPVSVEFAP